MNNVGISKPVARIREKRFELWCVGVAGVGLEMN
jgi:hypothetical protein